MKCAKCGSDNVTVKIIPVRKKGKYTLKGILVAGASFSMAEAFIFYFTPIGWFGILSMLLKGYKITEETWSVCQDCGQKELL